MAIDLVVYFDKSAQDHALQAATLPAAGYQLVTLDMYDRDDAPAADVRYVATWIKRAGSGQRFFFGLSRPELQAALADQAAQNYQPALLAASGDWDYAVYSVVFEPLDPVRPLTARFDIASLPGEEFTARRNGQVLRSVSVYG